MTCKDCIHERVCFENGTTPYYGVENACDNVEYLCDHFKNKSEYAEVKSCDKCIFLDVPSGHMPCIECSNYYISHFKQK